jgi:hypothetical protein
VLRERIFIIPLSRFLHTKYKCTSPLISTPTPFLTYFLLILFRGSVPYFLQKLWFSWSHLCSRISSPIHLSLNGSLLLILIFSVNFLFICIVLEWSLNFPPNYPTARTDVPSLRHVTTRTDGTTFRQVHCKCNTAEINATNQELRN